METQINLEAVILVTNFGQAVFVEERSMNPNFIHDIQNGCGHVEDVFGDMDIPSEAGFYLFNGQVDFGIDIGGYIEDANYSGEFKAMSEFKFTTPETLETLGIKKTPEKE